MWRALCDHLLFRLFQFVLAALKAVAQAEEEEEEKRICEIKCSHLLKSHADNSIFRILRFVFVVFFFLILLPSV